MQMRIQNVLYPFAILISLNFLMWSVWTVMEPLLWVRTDDDDFLISGQVSRFYGSLRELVTTN